MKIVNMDTVEQARKNRKRVPDIIPAGEDRITQVIADGKHILEELRKKQEEAKEEKGEIIIKIHLHI